ncbi:DUF7619 domain-containing protein [Aureispira anguillae]|uniref:T9SS type A sorting domain-containing protein n=1 Tax=Aureispira anguillae TaxID=2864201 RepID=A0A915YKJ2_9BACT|nr:T9SS type A sorting domain-containing protein [Aureispira anguillae]BDS14912.1 T9SS type A sorting domain-containing protein [Aureispira anguillae]
MNKIIIIVLGLLFVQNVSLGQGWIKMYHDYTSTWLGGRGIKTLDNGYVLAGKAGSPFASDVHIKKTDQFGGIQWTYTLPDKGTGYNEAVIDIEQVPSDGSYVILYSLGGYNDFLLRIDGLGQLMYDLPIHTGMYTYAEGSPKTKMVITSDEHLLVTSFAKDSLGFPTLGLAKFDVLGNRYWTRLYNHLPNFQSSSMDVIEVTDGNYILAGRMDTCYYGTGVNNPHGFGSGNGVDLYLIKTDTGGNDLWRQTVPIPNVNSDPQKIINTNDDGFLVVGGSSSNHILAMKLDASGNKQWHWLSNATSSASFYAYDAVENIDGSYTLIGHRYSGLGFIKLSSTGATLVEKTIYESIHYPRGRKIYAGSNGGYAIVGGDAQGSFIAALDSTGVLYSNHIVGNYFYDLNGDCLQNIGEPILAHRVVNATKHTENLLGTTNANGEYTIEVDTGTYSVSSPVVSPYWQFCQNPQTVTFNNFYSQDTVDFAVQLLDTCVYMEVDIAAAYLRRCFPSTYFVKYNNWGTKAAQNVYVELTLDPYLTFDSSSIPLTSQIDNVYRFDVGTVPILGGGQFEVYVTVDCDSTLLGQTHCTEAHIYPDTICIPNYWNGPIIQASSTCANDSVTFRIRNVGTNMQTAHNYSIIEEHVMIQAAPFQLGGGIDQYITVPAAPGATYRLEANQALGYPPLLGDPIAISNNVACNTTAVINYPGLVSQFYNGNSTPSISNDCRQNRGSYDPNDKQAQPLGYGSPHYIAANIPLNYQIRFQNTGTDTAFSIVVIDTLDPALDPLTITMGASSHPYTWELRGNNILVVTFDPIMLPDSNVNAVGSNGFFNFNIAQRANNPDGTIIYNRAGIYFDFNPPIITNETYHTIGSNFVQSIIIGTDNVLDNKLSIKVFPNPFESFTIIEVEQQHYRQLELELVSITGQLIKSILVENTNQIKVNRNQLAQGVYGYRLKGDHILLNTGKLIVR